MPLAPETPPSAMPGKRSMPDRLNPRAPEHENDPHKGSDSDTTVKKAVDPDPDGAPEHNPQHVKSVVDGLKGLLGIDHTPVMGEANPSNRDTLKEAGISGALNRGIADGHDASNEY